MIWVEILGRNREVLARHRCERLPATLGRAYAADIVIDDPAVAPLHLRIERGESGRLRVDDLGTLNGLRVDQAPDRVKTACIDGDSLLHVGGTCLRIRTTDHPVAPERRLSPDARDAWAPAGWLLAALGGLSLLQLWMAQTTEVRPSAWVGAVVYPALMALLWAGTWSVLNRVFAGRTRFARHFAIALLGSIVLKLVDPVMAAGAYMFSAGRLASLAFIPTCLLAAAVALAHLRTITLRRHGVQFALVGLATATALGLTALSVVERAERLGPATVVDALMPPGLRVGAAVSQDDFLQATAALSPDLERARLEEPKEGAGMFEFE